MIFYYVSMIFYYVIMMLNMCNLFCNKYSDIIIIILTNKIEGQNKITRY
jgi:hypothetical protein